MSFESFEELIEFAIEKEKEAAYKDAQKMLWMTYKNYKKTHGYLAW